jgi:hypothetical protein
MTRRYPQLLGCSATVRFHARHIGSGVWGVFDAGVMGWRATDLADDEALQRAADLNVIFNQYSQRNTISTASATKKIAERSSRRSRWSRPRGRQLASSIGGFAGCGGWPDICRVLDRCSRTDERSPEHDPRIRIELNW